jgi:hypothetical protein
MTIRDIVIKEMINAGIEALEHRKDEIDEWFDTGEITYAQYKRILLHIESELNILLIEVK